MRHQTTRGIVLGYIKYGDSSIIVRIFTELFGKQSYIVNGVRQCKPKYGIALFQPLVPLDLVVYHKKNTSLQRIIEAKCHVPTISILSDLKKSTIAIFLSELLNKAIYADEQNDELFKFLLYAVMELNTLGSRYDFFYLRFMLQLCHYLGFGMSTAAVITEQLEQVGFQSNFSADEMRVLNSLLHDDLETILKLAPLSKASTRNLLTSLIRFFQLHIDTLDTLTSVAILQEINT